MAARCELEFREVHVKRVDIRIPNALSYWELDREHRQRFSEMTTGMVVTEKFVYKGVYEFVHDWECG